MHLLHVAPHKLSHVAVVTDRSQDTRYQVQVFGGADTGRDFLKSIHRRNDTFYVLSFDTVSLLDVQ